jgi:hypothetical protein
MTLCFSLQLLQFFYAPRNKDLTTSKWGQGRLPKLGRPAVVTTSYRRLAVVFTVQARSVYEWAIHYIRQDSDATSLFTCLANCQALSVAKSKYSSTPQ